MPPPPILPREPPMLLPPMLPRLPMLLEPILGGLKERLPPSKDRLPWKLLLLIPDLEKLSLLLLMALLPLKLRELSDDEPLGNTRVESILENEPDGAWRMALSMLLRKATS